ncbi:proline iminopeptidase [Saccharothrix coeruleofusca]|uniref:prolyl aminopeptidase n=1 Tax=Saccharothrix coeruleofusca TaxID=33919 RepID=UPI001AE3C1C6|nr:prolyl aminopeptidase [Saccharothrix coeruleofusca]MBP2337549.1 proline iminopeptidase [Saccharothrix coeruleofusca]
MLYPEIEPYDHGMLDVGDGHHVYWEVCGNPDGKPAVVLHGGPGAGCTPNSRRYFDPAAYRVVLLDQRGCGRSTPHAGAPVVDLSANTTDHLIGDLELLRERLGVDRWLLFGASWGAVLGLVYAERFPHRVSEIVLAGVATGRQVEVDLLTRGLGHVFPQAWARFRDGVPAHRRDGDLAAAYLELLLDPDPAVHRKAADDWCTWEDAMLPQTPNGLMSDYSPEYRLAFARLVTHYWAHGSWLTDGAVLAQAHKLAGIPGVVVQGELDLGNLVGTPWLLERVWPEGELVLIREIAHGGGPGMTEARVAATDRFRP